MKRATVLQHCGAGAVFIVVFLNLAHLPMTFGLSFLSPGTFYWLRPISSKGWRHVDSGKPVKSDPKPRRNDDVSFQANIQDARLPETSQMTSIFSTPTLEKGPNVDGHRLLMPVGYSKDTFLPANGKKVSPHSQTDGVSGKSQHSKQPEYLDLLEMFDDKGSIGSPVRHKTRAGQAAPAKGTNDPFVDAMTDIKDTLHLVSNQDRALVNTVNENLPHYGSNKNLDEADKVRNFNSERKHNAAPFSPWGGKRTLNMLDGGEKAGAYHDVIQEKVNEEDQQDLYPDGTARHRDVETITKGILAAENLGLFKDIEAETPGMYKHLSSVERSSDSHSWIKENDEFWTDFTSHQSWNNGEQRSTAKGGISKDDPRIYQAQIKVSYSPVPANMFSFIKVPGSVSSIHNIEGDRNQFTASNEELRLSPFKQTADAGQIFLPAVSGQSGITLKSGRRNLPLNVFNSLIQGQRNPTWLPRSLTWSQQNPDKNKHVWPMTSSILPTRIYNEIVNNGETQTSENDEFKRQLLDKVQFQELIPNTFGANKMLYDNHRSETRHKRSSCAGPVPVSHYNIGEPAFKSPATSNDSVVYTRPAGADNTQLPKILRSETNQDETRMPATQQGAEELHARQTLLWKMLENRNVPHKTSRLHSSDHFRPRPHKTSKSSSQFMTAFQQMRHWNGLLDINDGKKSSEKMTENMTNTSISLFPKSDSGLVRADSQLRSQSTKNIIDEDDSREKPHVRATMRSLHPPAQTRKLSLSLSDLKAAAKTGQRTLRIPQLNTTKF